MIVRDIYDRVTSDLLERGGFRLGIVTDAEFLSHYSDTANDFLQQSQIARHITCQPLQYGIDRYDLPGWMNTGDDLLIDEATIRGSSESDIADFNQRWRNQLGPVRAWGQDKMRMSTVRLFPAPAKDGPQVTMAGASVLQGVIGSVVDGDISVTATAAMLGTIGGESGSVAIMFAGPMLGIIGDIRSSKGNIAVLGKASLFEREVTLDSPIELLLDTFAVYLIYGILAKIFGTDGETKDELRRDYCRARYDEGVMLAQAIMNEDMQEEAA